MDSFSVGETVIGQNFIYCLENNGDECEIIGGLKLRSGTVRRTRKVKSEQMYIVKWSCGKVTAQAPCHLRKKKPPEEDIEEMDWVKLCNLKVLEAV